MIGRIGALCGLALCLTMGSAIPVSGQLPPASFHHLKRDEHLLSSGYYCLAEDEYGFIWFGSIHGGGLYRFDGYRLNSFIADPADLEHSILSSAITTVYAPGDGYLYAGTHGGFSRIHLRTGDVSNFSLQGKGILDYRMYYTEAIVKDRDNGVLWVGLRDGLYQLDSGDSLVACRPGTVSASERYPDGITAIVRDKNDSDILWLGSVNGLFSYHSGKREYQHIGPPGHTEYLVRNVYQDDDGAIWLTGWHLGSHGNVMRYKPQHPAWEVKTIPGIYSESLSGEVYALLPAADADTYWLSTEHSVGIFHHGTGMYDAWTYDPANPDGLLINGFYRAMSADRHGRLWIASWHGIQYAKQPFVPSAINVPEVNVTIVDVYGAVRRAGDQRTLIYTEGVTLSTEERDVTLHYVLPNPLDQDRVEYQYMLEGYDRDWIDTRERSVRYTRLRGGAYRFHVRAHENSGNWTGVTTLDITLEKKIHELWWFWPLLLITIGGIVVLVSMYLIRQAKQKERVKSEFEQKLMETEMLALRSQMNPHFLFNSLNSIKSYAISRSKDETADYLTTFSQLVRKVLDNSKDRTISLKDELEALRLYIEVEHLRLEGRFDYVMDIDSSLRIDQAQIPPMVLQPYVENAIWHGLMHRQGKGRLLVQVKEFGNRVQCIIEDNGIGRAAAQAIRKKRPSSKASMGMQITGDRIALINKVYGINTEVHILDLSNRDGTPAGTRVVIVIPLITEEEE